MIPVPNPIAEPDTFDDRCRKRGNAWLLANPEADRPYAYWTEYNHVLAEAFSSRCGFSGQWISSGTIDHFQSWHADKSQAYEWDNFRYVEGWLNSSKSKKPANTIMDPFFVQSGWFEIILPSLQLVVSNTIPAQHRALAESTLKQLPIGHDERILRPRRQWLKLYEDGDLSLAGLEKFAPLIAAAVRKRDGL